MGQRAVITTKQANANLSPEVKADSLAVYVHWLGERRYIDAFLYYARLQEFRPPEADPRYAYARLAQVIANYIDGNGGVGIIPAEDTPIQELDPDDDGVYLIENWYITAHYRQEWDEATDTPIWREAIHNPDLDEYTDEEMDELMLEIDRRQPEHMQLGDKVFNWRKM